MQNTSFFDLYRCFAGKPQTTTLCTMKWQKTLQFRQFAPRKTLQVPAESARQATTYMPALDITVSAVYWQTLLSNAVAYPVTHVSASKKSI